jgi:hypothetical protein
MDPSTLAMIASWMARVLDVAYQFLSHFLVPSGSRESRQMTHVRLTLGRGWLKWEATRWIEPTITTVDAIPQHAKPSSTPRSS